MAVFLIIIEDNKESSVRLTSHPTILGRSSKSQVQIKDQMCSGKHCAFKLNQQFQVLVKDLESTNGTYVNDCQIKDSHLMLDDIIKIGNCEIFIDPSQLSPKEKAILTRDEPTAQIKFMDLPSQKKPVRPSQVVRKKVTSESSTAEKGFETVDQEKNKPNASLKDRIKARGESLKNQSSATQADELVSERQIDLEESNGDTQFIKINKLSSKPKRKEKSSLASRIKKVFKK